MRKIFFGVLGCLGLVSQAYALGINYGEILVENLQIGTTYNLTEIANLPLEVNNDSDEALTIQAEPLKPDKPIVGYEAVPSVAWIKISPAKFPMQPRVKHLSDVHITIPQDRKYLGRKYQVDIFTHSAENADGMNFMSVKLGIKGRLLFTVAPVVLKPATQSPLKLNLNFKVMPERFESAGVVLGKKVEVLTPKNEQVEIQNLGSDPVEVALLSLAPGTVNVKDEQFEPCPDPAFLSFEKSQITVPGKSKENLKMWLEIPDKPEYNNKKYLFLVSAGNAGSQVAGRRHLRLYVRTGGVKPAETEKKPSSGK